MTQIQCKNLTLCYDKKEVVNHLTFEVNRGEIIAVVGENGSGKSTLLKSLLGLKKPDGGEILYGTEFSPRCIGYLPQQKEWDAGFPATVWEVVDSGLVGSKKLRLFATRPEKERVANALTALGITELANQWFGSLSGGQQQRVLLARALVAARSVLILDEPVTGLDPKATAAMYESIKTQNRRNRITVLMVSHDVDGVLSLADKVLHLSHQDYFFGTTEEYLLSPFGKQFLKGDSICG